MKFKILLRLTLLLAILAGFSLSISYIFHLNFKNSKKKNDDTVLTTLYQAKPGLPVRLRIPKINVDAVVQYVGVTPEGAMDTPKDPLDVAWYNQGPHPGEIGSAVLAGHEGWKDGIRAVFDDLHKLVKGDKLYVEDEKGDTVIFVVREIRVYGENEEASEVFLFDDGKAHLNLVTCGGVWNKTKKSYSERLVVFADKE